MARRKGLGYIKCKNCYNVMYTLVYAKSENRVTTPFKYCPKCDIIIEFIRKEKNRIIQNSKKDN